MPEGMSIWRDRNVSCDISFLSAIMGRKEADGWQGKRKYRKQLLFG